MERLLLPLEQRGFEVFGEVACRVTDHSLPNTDVAVFSRERWEAQDVDEFVREAPALAVEVASPSNRQMRRKAVLYLEHGAQPQHVWIVYPKTRRVLVMMPDADDDQVRKGESVEFHGLRIAVADLFQ